MRRVHGSTDADSFRIIGFSNRHTLEWALRRGTGLESRRGIFGFDLVIGISIFTHVAEPVQFEWLAELARLPNQAASPP